MAAFEDSYKPMLQGVSQQIARHRQDGQVSDQLNMLSDTVTDLRRRPGAQHAYNLSWPTLTADSLVAVDTDVAGEQVQVLLNTADGSLRVLSQDYTQLASLTSAYLANTDVGSIQMATAGDELYILNKKVIPALGVATVGQLDPTSNGFIHIKAGVFNTFYAFNANWGASLASPSYRTPDGTAVGHAEQSTPEYIAEQLAIAFNALALVGITAYAAGGVIFFAGTGQILKLAPFNGQSLMTSSGAGSIRLASDLPPTLGGPSNGYVVRVGDLNTPAFYQWSATSLAWLECGEFGGPGSLVNMPVVLSKNGAVWSLGQAAFEGRNAGAEINNPTPEFVGRGISGMGSYQGRLVLTAGSLVYMSASNKPLRFYRSTVTAIIDSDTIGVGAADAASAAYEYVVAYDKDLLLFSSKYQAVISGAGGAVTPRTASPVVLSTYEGEMTAKPLGVGRTVMFPSPRSAAYFGIMEMVPATDADAKYTVHDSTEHLPKYFVGRCRDTLANSATNLVLFFPEGGRKVVVVHQYAWNGNEKVQQAWHKWEFQYPVAAAYFSERQLHLCFVRNGTLVTCVVDPQAGVSSVAPVFAAALDVGATLDHSANEITLPGWLVTFAGDDVDMLRVCMANGNRRSAAIGYTRDGSVLTVLDYVEDEAQFVVGYPYISRLQPSPPMRKDRNNVVVSSNKGTVLRYMVGTSNSQEYFVYATDEHSDPEYEPQEAGPSGFFSTELELDTPVEGGENSVVIVPCRLAANTAKLVLTTEGTLGTGELNLVSLEYVMRYREKVQRARF